MGHGGGRQSGGRGRGRGRGGVSKASGRGRGGGAGSDGKGNKFWSLASKVHKQAAEAIARLLAAKAERRGGVSIKSLTLAPEVVAKKATYAVTHETLRYLAILKEIIQEVGVLDECEKLQPEAAYVLAYEVLIGQGCNPHGGAERAILSRKAKLEAALQQRLDSANVKNPSDLLNEPDKGAPRPRSARVNTLKRSVEEALRWLNKPPTRNRAHSFQHVKVHPLLPDVLLFPEGTDLHDHPLVLDSTLILQSIASCMPAHALSPVPARMKNKGKVMAFDRDRTRLKRLVGNAEATGASCITADAKDFMSIDPTEQRFSKVRGVILDPSCSGSGLVLTRGDHLLLGDTEEKAGDGADISNDTKEKSRVDALARFQEAALKHALKFPALERIVYSTCSIHSRENEEVVAAALPLAHKLGMELVDPFPNWHRRGLPLVEGAEKLVRTDPYEDGTDGFFVAVFQRASQDVAGIGGGSDPSVPAGTESEAADREERMRLKRRRKKQRQKEKRKFQKGSDPAGSADDIPAS